MRRRMSIDADQLEVLRRVSNGDTTAEHALVVDELAAVGLVTTHGAVHPLVADLALTMTQPMIELWIESAGPQGQTLSHIVIRGDETLWYTDPWPGGADDPCEVVYTKDELPQLIWIVARLVGFRRAAPPGVARPVTATFETVAALMTAFGAAVGSDWDDVRTVAIAGVDDIFGEMTTEQREMWMAVLATLEATWRVTCTWGPGAEHVRGLAVWDCGPGGFWVRTAPAEPLFPEDIVAGVEATFVPTSAGDIWRALTDLLPTKAELETGVEAMAVSMAGPT